MTEILHNGINSIREHILGLQETIERLKEKNENLENNESKGILFNSQNNVNNPTSLNANNEGVNVNMNLDHDELVKVLNGLSNSIKSLIKNSKLYIGSAKNSADSVRIIFLLNLPFIFR